MSCRSPEVTDPPNPAPLAPPAAAPVADFGFVDGYVLGYTQAGSHLRDYIYERSRARFAQGDAARDALTTAEAVRRRQAEIRARLLEGIGGLPPSDTPLNARLGRAVRGAGFTVEPLVFESRPRHFVTASLYRPEGLQGPVPAVLFLCGHHLTAKQAPEYQAVCQTLVQAGLIVLAQDPIGQGERLSYYEPGEGRTLVPPLCPEHDYAGAQCRFVGAALARYFLHDAMRGIDYLQSRPDVDPARIGVTGNSGGGTQTSLVMLADPRIAAAAPATFITDRDSYQRTGQAQDAEQIWPGFTRAGCDHADILLALAPKPVGVLAVKEDFFPIEGTRRTVERCRRIWRMLGAPDALELVEDDGLHRYSPALAQAAARFFARHLLGREVPAPRAPQILPPEQLAATKSGQVRGECAGAEFVFEANHARVTEAASARHAAPEQQRREAARAWLREQVLRDRVPCAVNVRRIERDGRWGGLAGEIAFWWVQPGLANLGALFRPAGATQRLPVTLALWDGGTSAVSRHADWLRAECAGGRAVLVLSLSGVGPLQPDPINPNPAHEFYGTFHKLSDDLDWLGDSLVALRTYETLRALEALAAWPELDPADVRVYAHGRLGVHGRLAAALDPRIRGCEWQAGFRFADFAGNRIYDSAGIKEVVLPGVLCHFDLDEL